MSVWEIIIPLIWAGGLLGAGLGISKKVEGSLSPDYFFPSAGVLGLLIFALGLSGMLFKSIFIAFTIIFLVLFIWIISAVYRDLIQFFKARPFYLILIIVPLLWYALASLSYPVSTDALYFHLGIPKIYADAGRISFIPANLFSASPQTSEMISTGFYALGLERGAQFFIMLVAAILVLSVWKKANELGVSGTIAVLLLFTIPIFMGQVTGSKNDYLLWGLSFFAILKFLQYDLGGKTRYLILSGIGAGMAAGTKAIGLALLGPIALIIICNIVLGKYRVAHFFYFLILFLSLASPWYIYSWIVAGNPVYPFFDSFFHSPYSSALFNSFNKELAIKTIDRNLLNLIISPLRLMFDPEAFDGRIGYGIILFPALILLMRRAPQYLRTSMGISIIFYLIWFLGFPYARFLLPVAPLLAIAGSYFISSAISTKGLLKIAAMMSLALGALLPIPSVFRDTRPRVASVVKATPKYEFLENLRVLDPYQPHSEETIEGLSYIKSWEYINDKTPINSRIGILASFLTRADGYYLDRKFLYLNPSEQNLYDFTSLRDDKLIDASLKKLGITHIVLDSVILKQFSSNSPWARITGFQQFADGVSSLRTFCENAGKLIYSDSRYKVYKI